MVFRCSVFVLMVIGACVSPCPDIREEHSEPPTPSKDERPHIVIMIADDLGWADLGYQGSQIRTPRLDALAAQGAQLRCFYVNQICTPTRASLMTGRYAVRMGLQRGVIMPWSGYGMPLEERTLPEALREAGYKTVMVGKWHLGAHDAAYLPTRRGFGHHYGSYYGGIDYYTHRHLGSLDWHRNEEPQEEDGYAVDLVAREAVALIQSHDSASPLFLYVAFHVPHTPLQAPQESIEAYAHIREGRRRIYAAMVSRMDEAVGRMIDELARREMWDNTVLFFSGDNGGAIKWGANNGWLRDGKGSLYEGGVRAPAFVVWPKKLQAGVIVDEPLHIIDLYPTVLKIAGASLDPRQLIDGRDIWSTIAEGHCTPHGEILLGLSPEQAAIRRGEWKLVINGAADAYSAPRKKEDIVQLFYLPKDPQERKNLAGRHPDLAAELRQRIATYEDIAIAPRAPLDWEKVPPDFQFPAVLGPQRTQMPSTKE